MGCNGRVVAAPPADVTVTESLVTALLSAQSPALAELPVARLASGWDNELFRLGDSMLVRLPRREASAPLMEHEVRWLPTIGSLVDTEIPLPVFVGRADEQYPYTWTIVPFIKGTPVSDVPVAERADLAEDLADFFWSLHVPAPSTAPLNPVRGVSLAQARFDERVRERLADEPHRAELLARWEAWSAAPEFDGVDVWVHGDAHPHNLVQGPDGRLAGVVDWGDMTAGDPATDLATAWLTFDAEGRRRFIERIGGDGLVDADTWTRAKAWALHLGLILVHQCDDQPWLTAIGRHALEQLLAEPV